VLGVAHSLRDAFTVITVTEHLRKECRTRQQVSRRLGEHVVERRVGGAKARCHGELLKVGVSKSAITVR